MQSFSKVPAAQTSYRADAQFKRRWLHGSLTRQASIRVPVMMTTGDTIEQVLFEVDSDFHALELVNMQDNHHNSPSILVSSPLSTPMSGPPSLSANFIMTTTNGRLPPGPFVSPLFSPLTPTMKPLSPFLEKHSMGYRYKASGPPAMLSSWLKPGVLELDFAAYATSSHATIPSPFRMQLQEDVATTPLPSTPLTARWPGSGVQRSALKQEPS